MKTSVSTRALRTSPALRKAHGLKVANAAGRTAGVRDSGRAKGKSFELNAGLQVMETDNGSCYGLFCYNFEFTQVSRDRDENSWVARPRSSTRGWAGEVPRSHFGLFSRGSLARAPARNRAPLSSRALD